MRQVSITTRVRPPRFLWLVTNHDELRDAVHFLCHTPGGTAGYIAPIPRTSIECTLLRECLVSSRVDFVVTVVDELPDTVSEVLDELSIARLVFGAKDLASAFAENKRDIPYHNRLLPHMSTVLDDRGWIGSVIACGEQPAAHGFDIGMLLQCGSLSESHRQFLSAHLPVYTLKQLTTLEEYIRASTLVSNQQTARNVALTGLKWSWDMDSLPDHYSDILYLYLFDAEDLTIPCLYWNQSGVYRNNKLLLPEALFRTEMEQAARVVAEGRKDLANVTIIGRFDQNTAECIQQDASRAFAQACGKTITLCVEYNPDPFDADLPEIEWGVAQAERIIIGDNHLVTVNPNIPRPYRDTNFLFAFDAEITDDKGHSLSLPNTKEVMRILTYGPEAIRPYAGDYDGLATWMRRPIVRGSNNGVHGVGSERLANGTRASVWFYLPPDELCILLFAEQRGLKLKAHPAPRAARAFIRKFGVLDRTNRSQIKHDLDVAECLLHSRKNDDDKTQSGLMTLRDIVGRLRKGRNEKEVSPIVKGALVRLIRAKLVERGVWVQCDQCEYETLYALRDIAESVTCVACDSPALVPVQLDLRFRLTDLALDFFQNGNRAVLLTLLAFNKMLRPGILDMGGKVQLPGIGECDADLIRLSYNEGDL